MTDILRVTLLDVCHGMRDAVLGSLFVFRVDAEMEKIQEEMRKKREEKMMEARRRPLPQREKKQEEPKVMHRILQCCALNVGVFWLSLIVFNNVLLPLLQWVTTFIAGAAGSENLVWSWMKPMLSYTFSAFWVLPLFLLSKAVSALWFQDIADLAYRKSRGRPQLPSLSRLIADLLFSVLIQILFLLQSMVVSLVPIKGVSQFLSMFHLSLLNALYAFEYKWFNMGWEVHTRIAYIETNWPYFLGFGLPLALITSLPKSYFVSGCVFSTVFPLFIISGNEAQPPPKACDFQVRIFSFVVGVANKLFYRTVKGPIKSSRSR
ncbi:etoposide-induced protein 2.4 [Strongylocentrotus purpuratus]|uniref:Etoposide-induced protein 2.4 homolog n=1 Tax=Strongylocentrotus purpuratus TaxID=7668 RepID=A0A7M7SV34_STRPU|nr:etoposide-induced protein 2.4 [Strongylocentrotus purpuratus]XP_030833377.1 etoposide-induced protein 2.4 [Strongylocentrotus purpuratus]|eukprot:XP_797588.2 PREDICTED: etoposide-induced protein 2.4 [Strongylocentrotus purpuratus]